MGIRPVRWMTLTQRARKIAIKGHSLIQLLFSTLAAFFGVQSDQNRHRDFQSHSPIPYIIMGIILAIGLVIGLIVIVNLVLT